MTGRSAQVAALALIGLAAFPAPAQAVDLTPDTTRYLSDPSFLPAEGQIYSETTYSHADRSEDFKFADGFRSEHHSSGTDRYSQTFGYGVTDRLSLSASGSYSDAQDHYSFADGGSSSPRRSDFDNPSFAITYRAIEQTDSPVSVDVKGSYSPAAVGQTSQSG